LSILSFKTHTWFNLVEIDGLDEVWVLELNEGFTLHPKAQGLLNSQNLIGGELKIETLGYTLHLKSLCTPKCYMATFFRSFGTRKVELEAWI